MQEGNGHLVQAAEVSGYLFKRRGGFGKHMPNSWQQRFFVIKDGILSYFEDDEDTKPRGRLDLKSSSLSFSVGTQIENSPTVYTMQLMPPPGTDQEKWKLCAETREDLQRWSVCIEKHVRGNSVPPAQKSPSEAGNIICDEDDSHNESKPNSILIKSRSVSGDSIPHLVDHSRENLHPSKRLSTLSEHPDMSDDLLRSPQKLQSNATGAHSKSDYQKTAGLNHPSADARAQSQSSTTTALPARTKKRLKLNSDDYSQREPIEFALVIVILNLCYLLSWFSSLSTAIFYLFIANIVVGRTLWLRALRTNNVPDSNSADSETGLAASKLSSTRRHGKSKEAVLDAVVASKDRGIDKGQLSETSAKLAKADVVAVVNASPLAPGELPVAGATYNQVFSQPPNVPDHTWCRCDHKQFQVRIGPDYNRFKKKAPSAPPIFEAVAMDVFCTKLRVDFVSSRIKLPDVSDLDLRDIPSHVPPVFVIQIQIPSDPPPLFGNVEDGPGWAIVMYFKLTAASCDHFRNLEKAPAAYRLFAKWCELAPTDPSWRGRFKVIDSCLNLEELGVPQFILSYNAKPVLIRRTGSIFKGTGHMEMDIHVHKFAAMAKRSIHLLSSRCGLMYMQIGFVIEGREDSELPEGLFACVGVNRPQEDRAEFLFDDD